MGEKQGHTPGEWKFVQATKTIYGVLYAGGKQITIFRKPISDEDGRLIAAAPDLLEAVRQVMGWIDGWDPNFTHDPEWPEAAHYVRATIAKATGEDSPANGAPDAQ